MPEMIPQGQGVFKEGYKPNTKVAILELHRLVCIFLASKQMADLRQGPHDQSEVFDFLQDSEGDEITRILLTVAITARVIDDLQEGVFVLLEAGPCGTLQDGQVQKNLSLREACNKILHATKIRFDVDENEQGQKYMNAKIYLYGQRNGVEWKATLDVLEFAKQYVKVVRLF